MPFLRNPILFLLMLLPACLMGQGQPQALVLKGFRADMGRKLESDVWIRTYRFRNANPFALTITDVHTSRKGCSSTSSALAAVMPGDSGSIELRIGNHCTSGRMADTLHISYEVNGVVQTQHLPFQAYIRPRESYEARPQLAIINNYVTIERPAPGQSYQVSFQLLNTGTAPLMISDLQSPSADVALSENPKPIAAGSSGYITATVSPHGQGGFRYYITFRSNDPEESEPATLIIKGKFSK